MKFFLLFALWIALGFFAMAGAFMLVESLDLAPWWAWAARNTSMLLVVAAMLTLRGK